MIKEVYGNIIWSKSDAIVQGIAQNEDFSEGLASSVKEEWPAIEEDFKQCCCNHGLKQGDVWEWENASGVNVMNLVTHGDSKKASLSSLDDSLSCLASLVKKRGLKSLAIPKVGTDVGNLDWREVKPLIEKHLGELEIPVYLYSIFHKNIAAVEE
ncbi:MAG: Appr-1-p processing protein [Cellvibrionales bacterium]|nr:MAG: Appr-1-p processing protein [Cellvibrionales bacterium]